MVCNCIALSLVQRTTKYFTLCSVIPTHIHKLMVVSYRFVAMAAQGLKLRTATRQSVLPKNQPITHRLKNKLLPPPPPPAAGKTFCPAGSESKKHNANKPIFSNDNTVVEFDFMVYPSVPFNFSTHSHIKEHH